MALHSWLLYLLALPSRPIFLYLPSHLRHITLPSYVGQNLGLKSEG
jgi:hypothetical protein